MSKKIEKKSDECQKEKNNWIRNEKIWENKLWGLTLLLSHSIIIQSHTIFFFNIQTKHLNFGFALKHILSKKTHLKKKNINTTHPPNPFPFHLPPNFNHQNIRKPLIIYPQIPSKHFPFLRFLNINTCPLPRDAFKWFASLRSRVQFILSGKEKIKWNWVDERWYV